MVIKLTFIKFGRFQANVVSDGLYSEENKAAWTKMMISTDDKVNFNFSYKAIGGNHEKKKMNKFLSVIALDTVDPQQIDVVISSSNFNAASYPSNSKHLLVFGLIVSTRIIVKFF